MAKTGDFFYYGDYYKDTRSLSLAARGGWVDLFGQMIETGGTLDWPVIGYARFWGVTEDEAMEVLLEIQRYKVGDVEIYEPKDDAQKNGKNILPLAKFNKLIAKVTCRRIARASENAKRVSEVRSEVGKRGAEKRWQAVAKNGYLPSPSLNLSRDKNLYLSDVSKKEPPELAVKAARFLADRVVENHPGGTVPTDAQIKNWSKDADLINRRDHHSYEEIMSLLDWATKDSFWRTNILSMATFRKHWTKLVAKKQQQPKRSASGFVG